MENYFLSRTQSVRIGNYYSKPLEIKYGVPQGSILGPLLFIIYVNQIDKLPLNAKLIMYADDLVLYASHNNWNSLESFMSADINLIYQWSCANRLSINFKKSKLQIFCNKTKLPLLSKIDHLLMGNNRLERVHTYSYLGVIFYTCMTFESAMADAYSKFAFRLYNLSFLWKDMTKTPALTVVKTMLLPYFDYVSFVSCLYE